MHNGTSADDYKRFMHDPIHPNLEGYRDWWAPFIEEKIKEMYRERRGGENVLCT